MLERKCTKCKEKIYIDKTNLSSVVWYNKCSYHTTCFKQLVEDRLNSNRTKAKWSVVANDINNIQKQSIAHYKDLLVKDDIIKLISDNYEMINVPSMIIQRLAQIYNGTYKQMTTAIPPEHLYDMWHKQIRNLNRIAYDNATKGKRMHSSQRVVYDLAILINKYDSYMKWLDKQKIIAAQQNSNKSNEITTTLHNEAFRAANSITNNANNIESIVEDIF